LEFIEIAKDGNCRNGDCPIVYPTARGTITSRVSVSLTPRPTASPSWGSRSTCSERPCVRFGGDAWSRHFRDFERSAFRLELPQVHTMPDEEEDLRAFEQGQLPPPDYHYCWLDTVAEAVAQGKTFRRARIVTRPSSSYARWELVWDCVYNVAAGEGIRIPDATGQPGPDLPDHGFWLFDEATVVRLLYRPDGTQIGRELVEQPDLAACRAWPDGAWKLAVPFTDYH
jgi:hypothetical protein